MAELDRSHVGLHEMTVVDHVVLPAFEEVPKGSLASSLFKFEHQPHLRKHMRQKQLVAEVQLQDP